MKTIYFNKLFIKFTCLILLAFITQKVIAQAVVSNPLAIGQDCNKSAGSGFKVFNYAAGALTQIGANCTPSLAAPGFSPNGGSIAFSPADQKVYYIETTTGNNSIVWNWTPGTCPAGSQAPVYTYPATFIVGLEYNPITGDGYQIEFVGATAPYSIFLRKITSYGPPLVAGPSQQIFLPPGVKIYQQNGDVVMTPSGKMYFGFNNKFFSLDYSPYGIGPLNATYIDTLPLGAGVNLVGLSYVNGKFIAAATNSGSTCIYKEINISTMPVTLTAVTPPVGSAPGRTFSSLDMASLITGIGSAKKVFSVSKTGATTYQVKYDIKVKNFGNVNLTNVQLTDNVQTVFGASVFVSASVAAVGTLPTGLTINGLYNGSTNTNIFAAGGTMKATPKDSATVRVTVNLNNPNLATIYNNSATATATGAFFGVNVTDLSQNDLTLNPDPNNNAVPDDGGENVPTPLRLSDWIVVLPLKLIDFNVNANDKTTNFYWEVINDEKPLQMVLEQSSDGSNFKTIRSMIATTGTGPQKYSWEDATAQEGVRYYRLQLIPYLGNTVYSEIIKIAIEKKMPNEIHVSPVPFDQKIYISLKLQKNESVLCKIIDFAGETVYKTFKSVSRGENKFTIDDLSGIPPGNYVLRVRTSEGDFTKHISKTR